MKSFITILLGFLMSQTFLIDTNAQEAADKKEDIPTGVNWLHQFKGSWSSISKSADGSTVVGKGTMLSRKLGNNWVVNEFNATMNAPGGAANFTAIQTLGFDKKSNRFRGRWIDSMSDFEWTYDGELDKSGRTILLYAEGPDWTDPNKMKKYRDVYAFKTKDRIVATSQVQGEDGQWQTFVQGELTREDEKDDK